MLLSPARLSSWTNTEGVEAECSSCGATRGLLCVNNSRLVAFEGLRLTSSEVLSVGWEQRLCWLHVKLITVSLY